jgi:integrase
MSHADDLPRISSRNSATISFMGSVTASLRENELKRKGQQEGRLYRRGDSAIWHVSFRKWMADKDGNVKYSTTSESTKVTGKKEARKIADEIVNKANAPAECPRGTATVTTFVETFFWPQHVAHLRRNGQRHYSTQWRVHVKPSIGDMQMNDVTPVVVQRLITHKHMADAGTSQLRHIRNVISKIFTFARTMGYFKGDVPTAGITIPKSHETTRRDLTTDQLERILEHMGGKDKCAFLYKVYTCLLADGGFRAGEALGLEWTHLKLDASIAFVSQQWTKGELEPRTKNGKPRVVPLMPRSVEMLTAFRESIGDPLPRFVFHAPESKRGTPIHHNNFATRIFKAAAIAAGVEWASPHCLRHTNATLLDEAGVTETERMQVMGHSSKSMARHYTHTTTANVVNKLLQFDKKKKVS